MGWMGRDWRADQAFLLPSGALHGARPRRLRSRLGSRLEGGMHRADRRLGQRQCQWHQWQVGPCRCMGGLYVWWGHGRGVFVGGEVGSWKDTTVHRQSTQSRRIARGSSTNMVGVSLCLSSQGPKMAIEVGGARLPSGSGPSPRPTSPHLSHSIHPRTRVAFLHTSFSSRHPPPLPISPAHLLTSPIFHLPGAPC
jgi:hypothetical protein